MTDKEKLEANMACAKLLGHEPYIKRDIAPRGKLNPCTVGVECSVFDIFTNASQCLEVVKKLGEYHWTSPYYCIDSQSWIIGSPIKFGEVLNHNANQTYEEAVASAAMEVVKDGQC